MTQLEFETEKEKWIKRGEIKEFLVEFKRTVIAVRVLP